MSKFVKHWNKVANQAHEITKAHGFWDKNRNDGEMISMIHGEISEAMEALRDGPGSQSDKIPEFLSVEEELADAVLRIMDMATGRNWRIAEALEAKMEFNDTRPHKHGKEF